MAEYLPAVGTPEASVRASSLVSCGRYLEFRHYVNRDATRLAAARFCRLDRLCPLCAIRRGAKYARAYGDKVLGVLAESPHLVPCMLTVTTFNGPDLLERVKHYCTAWQRLLERRRNAHKRGSVSALAAVTGGVSSIEVKRGKGSGGWHVHSHSIILAPAGLPRSDNRWPQLSEEWHDLTGDSFILDLRPIRSVPSDIEGGLTNEYASDLCEVFKYALKFSELSLADNWHAYQILRGQRLVRAFGDLFGVPDPVDLCDDLLPADEPYWRLLFDFIGSESRYKCRSPFFVNPD